jgi:hypothetical protein
MATAGEGSVRRSTLPCNACSIPSRPSTFRRFRVTSSSRAPIAREANSNFITSLVAGVKQQQAR